MSTPVPEEKSWFDFDMESPAGYQMRWPRIYRMHVKRGMVHLDPKEFVAAVEVERDEHRADPIAGLADPDRLYLRSAAAALAEPRTSAPPLHFDSLLAEADPLELAHKAGESFFTPADTAEAILGQALLRRRRMEQVEQRYGLFKSEQVARLSGSEAKNTAQIAHRWQKQGRIFAVPVQGSPRFPGFQFDEHGQPRPVIAEILKILDLSDKGWAVASWFDAPHHAIPGQKSPAEVLATAPEQAVEAARATQKRADAWD